MNIVLHSQLQHNSIFPITFPEFKVLFYGRDFFRYDQTTYHSSCALARLVDNIAKFQFPP